MTWTVSDVMTKNATTSRETTAGVTTTGDMALAVAASLMFQHHATVLPVVDSRNRLVGTVTRAQVLKAFMRSDVSIRREIHEVLAGLATIGNVEAAVARGVVHLHGQVETEATAERIIRLIAGVPGVVGVDSHLGTPAARPTA